MILGDRFPEPAAPTGPHLPFIHRGTIGHDLPLTDGARMDIAWEDRPWGGHTTIQIDGKPQEGALDYRFPNAMQLWLPSGKRIFSLMNVCLPIDERTTRMIFVTIRDFLRPRLFDRLFHFANRRAAEEDRAVLESSDPIEVPPPGDERSVRTDEPTLRFRKTFRDRLQGSRARDWSSTAGSTSTATACCAGSGARPSRPG